MSRVRIFFLLSYRAAFVSSSPLSRKNQETGLGASHMFLAEVSSPNSTLSTVSTILAGKIQLCWFLCGFFFLFFWLFLLWFFVWILLCRTKQRSLCVVCLDTLLESLWLCWSPELTPVLVYSSIHSCRVLPATIVPPPHNSTTCPFSCQHSISLRNAVDQTNTCKEGETAVACAAL